MFDVSFWEFALIGTITLVVIGPERIPDVARKLGVYVAKAKRLIEKIQLDMSEQLKNEEIINKDANVADVFDDAKKAVSDIKDEIKQ